MNHPWTMPLNAAAVQAACTGEIGREIIHFDETTSTNEEARRLGEAGAPHGMVVVADYQQQGRGRRGSAWISPPKRNLLCSVLLRPQWPMQHWSRLTHAAALAILFALEHSGIAPKIKWPNDLYVGQRKIAGILLESASGCGGSFVVAGFGVNVNMPAEDFPPSLRLDVTSVLMETGNAQAREPLLAAILNHFDHCARRAEQAFPDLLEQIGSYSLLLHRRIHLHIQGTVRHGTVVGFSPEGGLLLESTSGEREEILSADQVRLA